MKTIEVTFSFAHPHRFRIAEDRIRSQLMNTFGASLLGFPIMSSSVTAGKSSTLVALRLRLPSTTKYPPDDASLIRAMGDALRVRREFGDDSRWTLAGWECWYVGSKYFPMGWEDESWQRSGSDYSGTGTGLNTSRGATR